jgi:cobaltochelatase CobS
MAKVKCLACGHVDVDLTPHFVNGQCGMTLEEYRTKFKNRLIRAADAPVRQPVKNGMKMALAPGSTPHPDDSEILSLTPRKFSMKELFGVDMKSDEIMGFDRPTKYTPEVDPNYVFPEEIVKMAYINWRFNRPMQITGETGTGKTTCIEQMAARLNIPLMKIMHTGSDMTPHHIKGQNIVKGREVVFMEGPLPFAMARPFWILLDEWPALAPETAFTYFSFLEVGPSGSLGHILLEEDHNRKVASHPMCRAFGTGNTSGFVDESGFYQGNQVQNLALIRRWLLKVKLEHLENKVEKAILQKKFPSLEKVEIQHLLQVAGKIRESASNGRISAPFSVSELLNWTGLYIMVGEPIYAMKIALANALPFTDSQTILEIVQRVFGDGGAGGST